MSEQMGALSGGWGAYAPDLAGVPEDTSGGSSGPSLLGLLTFATALIMLGAETGLPDVAAAIRPLRWYAYGAIIAAVLLMPPNRPLPRPTRADLFALPFLGLAAFSSMYSNLPTITFMRATSVTLQFVAIFWALRYHAERGRAREIESALILAVVLVLAAVPLVMQGVSIQEAFDRGRYRGIMANPNGVGLICALVLPLVYARLLERRTTWNLFAFCVLAASVALSGSRNGVFASVLGLSYVTYKWSAGERALAILAITGFVLVVGGTALFNALPLVAPGMYARFLPTGLGNGSGRLVAWTIGVRLVNTKMLLGHGFGTEDAALLGYQARGDFHGAYFHNSYLGLAYQLGVLGAALLFLPLLLLLLASLVRRRGHPSTRPGTAYEAVLLVGLFAAGFESWIYSAGNAFSFPFWTCVMLLLTTRAQLRRSRAAHGGDSAPEPAVADGS